MFISIICKNKISSADIEYMKSKVGVGMGFAVISANHIVISDDFTKKVEDSVIISINVNNIEDYFDVYETVAMTA